MQRKILWSSSIIVLAVVLLMAWLLATQSGLRTTISFVQKVVPELTIEQAEGSLLDEVYLKNLAYKPDNAVGVELSETTLQWQPAALFKATLLIEKLALTKVTVFLNEAEQEVSEPETITLPDINLPLRIKLEQLSVTELQTVSVDDENTGILKQLDAALEVDESTLAISNFSVQREDADLQLEGSLALSAPHQAALNYQIAVKQALPTVINVDGEITGNTQRLQVNQTVGEPLHSSQTVIINDVLADLKWTLALEADSLKLAEILPEQGTELHSLKLDAEGDIASMDASITSQVKQPEYPLISVSAELTTEDLKRWNIDSLLEITADSSLRLNADLSLESEAPSAELKAVWQNLQWPLTGTEIVAKSPTGQLIFSGSASAYDASLETDIEWQQQPLKLSVETVGTQNNIDIKHLALKGFDGRLDADGKLDWQAAPMQYQLNADWQGLQLPESLTEMALLLKQGQIQLVGTPEILNLSSQADIVVNDVKVRVETDASGHIDKGFDQTELKLALAEGKLMYQGKLLWQEQLQVEGKLSLDKLNPGLLLPAWPGSLSGSTQLRVDNQHETGVQLQAKKIDFSGSLRQRPLKLTGDVDYSQALSTIEQLLLQSGGSTLQANGQLAEAGIALDWELTSPDLQDFYPELVGQLEAKGKLKGTLDEPAINATLSGQNIQFEDIQVQAVSGDINLALSESASMTSQLIFEGLDLPQLPVDSLKLDINGIQKDHQINIDMVSAPLTVAISAEGGLNDQQTWRGKLNTFSLENEKAGKWALKQNGDLVISPQIQLVPEHCWASSNGDFCLRAENDQQGWQASGQFAALPVSLFEAFAVELEQLQGSLRGDFSLKANKKEAITGKGEIFLDDAALKLQQLTFNQQKPIVLNNTVLRYEIDEAQSSAQFHLEPDIEGVSAINAKINTVGLTQLLANPDAATIDGSVKTAIQDLSQLQLAHPAFTDLKGMFNLDLAVSGTTTQPHIAGQASLKQGQVVLVDAGIVLKQIEANINGNLEQVTFDYQAASGKGMLNGHGNYIFKDSGWELKTELEAKQFTLMNTPEALVIAEPELTISITPKLTKVSGKVTIPEAELEPTEFNTTVTPSRDVIVVSDEPVEDETGAQTEIDLQIILKDKVKLKASGFQGRLTGQLHVTGNTSDILTGNGEIKIKDGSYLAYGKLLKVDDGSIRFAGAIDNPELDIKAVRTGKDYKAGLHIEGYAASPQANLFSEPDMGQDDILSYILLGEPLDQASAADAAILASAATGLGLQNGAMIGDQIASTFGLDEFNVRGDSADNAALYVGKYLSPKLYLSYGIGVFESVSTVELRYELSKIWALKAESGTESGVDLLYTHERGDPDN
jgi:translocation and assembly module TamB